MRESIYYWKCDSPLDHESKRRYNSKYELADISGEVERVCSDFFGAKPAEIAPAGADGNHYGYVVEYPDARYFFRADDGLTEDDYMIVESAVMRIVAERGVPVPKVFHTDVSMREVSFRFQILQMMEEKDLNKHYQNKTLDVDAVGFQLGAILAEIHSIEKPGFGFVDSAVLADSGGIAGLNGDYASYFNTRLDTHLAYIVDNELISAELADDIQAAISANSDVLELPRGCLTHRDIAFWNILGTETQITAVIDWDDAVIGHPADDFGILTCFYDENVISAVKRGYESVRTPPSGFERARWLHALRNMLWKMMIRHYMGYFDQSGDFFILNDDNRGSLYDFTLSKIKESLRRVRLCGG
jgi:aminoglycoside phosphotransferase (APT) family kinase protein